MHSKIRCFKSIMMAGRASQNLAFETPEKEKSDKQKGLYTYNWRPDAPPSLERSAEVVLMQMTVRKYFEDPRLRHQIL